MSKTQSASKPKPVKYPSLVEVIFEMKWQLESSTPSIPLKNNQKLFIGSETYDPDYLSLVGKFEKEISKWGYRTKRTVNAPFPHVVNHRYFLNENDKFPILQIGQGIYAANTDHTNYKWDEFQKLVLKGLKAVLKNYPKNAKLRVTQLELRYVDVFDPQYLTAPKNVAFSEFINKETNAELTLPVFSFSPKLIHPATGRMIIQHDVKGLVQPCYFNIDLASIRQHHENVEGIRIISRVVSGDEKQIIVKTNLEKSVAKWLKGAHEILSPFFDQFIKPALHAKLKGDT